LKRSVKTEFLNSRFALGLAVRSSAIWYGPFWGGCWLMAL